MNRDDIIELIETNGLTLHGDIEHFANLVAAAEREACRRAFDAYLLTSDPGPLRARGNA